MPNKLGQILVVDDDEDVLTAARLLLKRHFAVVHVLSSPEGLPELMKLHKFDVVLLDMNFSIGQNTGHEGLQYLAQILELDPQAVIVMMTAYGDIETAVRAIREGASDFVLKPWQNEKLIATLNAACRLSSSQQQLHQLQEVQHEITHGSTTHKALIAKSPAMQQVLRIVEKSAPTDANMLILGENGVGKEVIAQEIFRGSRRREEIMLSVDLGAVPEALFESELFGHVKGAFTDARADRAGRFQAASGGTLFLDEIGNLPLHLQAKLLRVIETNEVTPIGADKSVNVDVRLICATNMPLEKMAEDGRFREDLLYRINTVQIEIPPLRERVEDIPVLLKHYIELSSHKYQKPAKNMTEATLKRLCHYHWPGNVRELAHAVERAIILSEGAQFGAEDFLLRNKANNNQENILDNLNLEQVEKLAIERALLKHQGNISHAAKALGITRTSLYRRIEKHQL